MSYTEPACLDRDGFECLSGMVSDELLYQVEQQLAMFNLSGEGTDRCGVRDLYTQLPSIRTFAQSDCLQLLVEKHLGSGAKCVRSLFFNKTPQANWKVPWHQDLTIAVRQKAEVEGFKAWSIKAGIPHVQPPVEILEQLLTVRIHLDRTTEANGALKVIAASHRYGKLSGVEIAALCNQHQAALCTAERGDVLLMRPLIVHSSSSGTNPSHRRVLHLEYAALSLPAPLEWYEKNSVKASDDFEKG